MSDSDREHIIDLARRWGGQTDLNMVDLTMMSALVDNAKQSITIHDLRNTRNEQDFINLALNYIAPNVMSILVKMAKEHIEANRVATPAPSVKVGDTVWITRNTVVTNQDGDRNIGFRVLVKEQRITEITWNGSKFFYVYGMVERDEVLTEAEIGTARDLTLAIEAAKKQGLKNYGEFIEAREEFG